MNAHILRAIARLPEAMGLAGDNLIVDLDLSEANLPAGCRLQLGDHLILEVTPESHTGCGKFARRFGKPALDFINGERGRPLNLRGRFTQVIKPGTISVGDTVRKL